MVTLPILSYANYLDIPHLQGRCQFTGEQASLGFTGVAIAAAGVAKLLFVIFLVLFVISLATHLTRRGSGV
jgi:uncharacterized membrane protein YtjA (UPF0391 family)